jgi:D-3-phosphoglycerate dehydrogenase
VHRNVPGVLGKMHTLLATAGINIHAEFLQSDRDTSFVILDVDRFGDRTLLDGLERMEETIRMRVAG